MQSKTCLFLLSIASVISGAESGFWESIVDVYQYIWDHPAEPEQAMTVSEIIRHHSFPVEIHRVTTEDGYILTMHRIPYGKFFTIPFQRPPVLFLHGMFCDSTMWVWNTPDKNLAYQLAEKDYDVWLGNFRGTKYSQNHTTLPSNSKKFWDFSWDQMAAFDLPAMIDYILDKTGYKQISYVGHAMGSSTIFALLSTRLEYNHKVKVVAALAPSMFDWYMKSPIILLNVTQEPLFSLIDLLGYEKLDIKDNVSNYLMTEACRIPLVNKLVCTNIMFAIGGSDDAQFNKTRLGLYFNKYPTTTSVKCLQHSIQLTNFSHFDFGEVKNQEAYGQVTPPEYNITQITTPIALFWGENDWMVPPEDVALIPPKLQNMVLNHKVEWAEFTHMDFVVAIDVNQLVNNHVIALFFPYRFKGWYGRKSI